MNRKCTRTSSKVFRIRSTFRAGCSIVHASMYQVMLGDFECRALTSSQFRSLASWKWIGQVTGTFFESVYTHSAVSVSLNRIVFGNSRSRKRCFG